MGSVTGNFVRCRTSHRIESCRKMRGMAILFDDNGGRDTGHDTAVIDIFLDPGEYFVGDAGYQVRTLLGSCVSTILWHPRLQIGAMSHIILPTRGAIRAVGSKEGSEHEAVGKYADEVLIAMIDELEAAGVPVQQCQAKIFGGGNMFPDKVVHERLNIGKRNGEAVLRLLALHRIPIVAQDLYGNGHRQVFFNVRNGDVWMRHFPMGSPVAMGDSEVNGC